MNVKKLSVQVEGILTDTTLSDKLAANQIAKLMGIKLWEADGLVKNHRPAYKLLTTRHSHTKAA